MKKFYGVYPAILAAAMGAVCLLSGCGGETASPAESAAETTTVTTASTESSVRIGTTKKGAGNAGTAKTAKTAAAVQTTTTAATTAAETQTVRSVYWTPIGKYWHYSKDCAKKELPNVTYNYKNEPQTLDDAAKESMIHETPESFGMKDRWEPCPDCVAEESSQQDGE